jgi:hypothetical protein
MSAAGGGNVALRVGTPVQAGGTSSNWHPLGTLWMHIRGGPPAGMPAKRPHMSSPVDPSRSEPITTSTAHEATGSVTPAVPRRVIVRPPAPTPAAVQPGPYVPTAAGDAVVTEVMAGTAELGQLLLVEYSTTAVLQKIAEMARAHVPGVAEASVTLMRGGKVSSVAWTGLLAYELDEAQYGSGFGPCLDAARTGTARWVRNSREDRRWPVYLAGAVRRGALSSFSVPVPVVMDGVKVGLNLYSTTVDGFTDAARHASLRLARQAAVSVTNRHAYDLAVEEVDGLRRAMESRAVIDLAKGILSFALTMTADEAFTVLSRRSQNTNIKVHDLATELVGRVADGDGQAATQQYRVPPPDPEPTLGVGGCHST